LRIKEQEMHLTLNEHDDDAEVPVLLNKGITRLLSVFVSLLIAIG